MDRLYEFDTGGKSVFTKYCWLAENSNRDTAIIEKLHRGDSESITKEDLDRVYDVLKARRCDV